MRIEENVPLARLTTLGAGGPARAFARPESLDELCQALAWARDRGLPVATIGLGSNLLVADDGVDALVLRLAGDLATAEVDGDLLVAGGGAANAVCLHRARTAGLGGFEFACAIPVRPRRSRRSSPTSRLSGRRPSRRTSARSGASSRTRTTSFRPAGC